MKISVVIMSAFLLAAGAFAPGFSQEEPSAASPAAAPAPLSAGATNQIAAPAAVEAVKPEAARPGACPHCFQPLPAGYKSILAELEPWLAEKEALAAAFDSSLSDIQKQIDAKGRAIGDAKPGTDKKASKAAVKILSKERKQLLNKYSATADERAAFYKRFAKELEKQKERHDKILEGKLKESLSAASRE